MRAMRLFVVWYQFCDLAQMPGIQRALDHVELVACLYQEGIELGMLR